MSFGKPARVDGPEVRALRRPAVRRRLADVVEAGPDELAGDECPRVDALPRALGAGPPGDDAVVVGRALVVARRQDVRRDRRLVDAAAPDGGRRLAGEELPARVARMGGVVAVRRVVEPDDVLHRRHLGARGWPSAKAWPIARVLSLALTAAMSEAAMVVLLLSCDLVADAPDDDARVVAVARHHVADVGRRPLTEEAGVVVLVLGLVPAVEGLVHHEEAEAIGDVEQLRRGRVVGRAERVDPHVLEHLEALLDGPVLTAAPRAPRSWWLQVPLSFTSAPFSVKPRVRARTRRCECRTGSCRCRRRRRRRTRS